MNPIQPVSLGNESAAPLIEGGAVTARDQELIDLARRIANGDQEALATLYDETNRLVYSLVYRILNDPTAAEEVTLDVYMQVWRQAKNYDTQRGALLTWLITIARSRAIDRFRATRQFQQRTDQLDLAAPPPAQGFASVEESALLSERGRIVRSALATLPPEQREVIELAYFLGLSHSEIAGRLNQPLGTVKTRVRLGMLKLRDLLKPAYERGL